VVKPVLARRDVTWRDLGHDNNDKLGETLQVDAGIGTYTHARHIGSLAEIDVFMR
ncbi:hypothetical protein J6590_037153, partial [Homalodisca vitripennis]